MVWTDCTLCTNVSQLCTSCSSLKITLLKLSLVHQTVTQDESLVDASYCGFVIVNLSCSPPASRQVSLLWSPLPSVCILLGLSKYTHTFISAQLVGTEFQVICWQKAGLFLRGHWSLDHLPPAEEAVDKLYWLWQGEGCEIWHTSEIHENQSPFVTKALISSFLLSAMRTSKSDIEPASWLQFLISFSFWLWTSCHLFVSFVLGYLCVGGLTTYSVWVYVVYTNAGWWGCSAGPSKCCCSTTKQ